MIMLNLRLFCSTLLLASSLAQAQPAPVFEEKEATREQVEKLQKGGFVIYMRHGKTDNSRPDKIDAELDLNDCNTQRLLSDEGRQMAESIGKSLRAAKIPVADIFVSPMCRTRDSAKLAFPNRKFEVINDLYSSTNQSREQKKPVIAVTRRLLSEPVAAGTNRFILAHAPNLADAMGYFPKHEGTVVIFIPKGADQFEYVASIRPDMWPKLLH
jgi:phosphohistidine phosphatase SixA